ncbi:MAG: twin-arginine translocase subunit TatB [Clostridia bacterium]|nr:twin-arginine translocase subunit TatB [Clostridia bacterium]
MFNIGFAELLLVLIIAYVIVGPKDLPKVARWLGRLVRQIRQMIRELKEESGWNELMAETADVRKDIDSTLKEADISKDLKDARKELQKNISEAEKDTLKK